MRDPLLFRERFIPTSWPGRLARRPERRTLRRIAPLVGILCAAIVGYFSANGTNAAAIAMSIGRSLAGLAGLGMVGLMAGVLATVLATFAYNGLLQGDVSLLDVEYIDEFPLIFAALGGIIGIIWSTHWPELVGLLGWGLVGLVITESVFRKPDNAER